ncbi:hypothetical protein BDW22DRAFT_1170935 [Trametopsis cervina]|nr:hypothetical protein BDW22DRAFT_1170935 [Trametopsis cervina]
MDRYTSNLRKLGVQRRSHDVSAGARLSSMRVPGKDESLARRERNMQTPVMRLPIDILVIVFEDVRGNPTTYGLNRTVAASSMEWIVVSQVCHHWRNVALALPTLWSFIHVPGVSPAWCREMLRRSTPQPLHVIICEDSGATSFGLEFFKYLLEKERGRLRILDLRGTKPARLIQIFKRCQTLPELAHLSVTNQSNDAIELPLGHLAKRCPTLDSLSVTQVQLNVEREPIPLRITTLKVVSNNIPPRSTYLRHFSDVLRAFPTLRRLVLTEPTNIEQYQLGTVVINLPPTMNRVEFRSSSARNCMGLLSYLSAPSASFSYVFDENISLDALKHLLSPQAMNSRRCQYDGC